MGGLDYRPAGGSGGGGGGGSSSGFFVSGTGAAPILITAAGGIIPPNFRRVLMYIAGNGGAVTVTKNPQIAAGNIDGDELELVGTSANSVTLNNGNGLVNNGPWIGAVASRILYYWNSAQARWEEGARNGL